MTKLTPLGAALLGLIADEPSTGYDLTLVMRERVRHFWSARHSQIYPELAALEAAGWARHEVVPQEGRPDKKVFTVTDQGREALAAWLCEPMTLPATRDEVVLKAYLGWLAPPERLAENLENAARAVEADVAYLRGARAFLEGIGAAAPDGPDAEFYGWATLRLGLVNKRAYAAWCRWLAREVRRRAARPRAATEKVANAKKKTTKHAAKESRQERVDANIRHGKHGPARKQPRRAPPR